jgi:hypothetical protein
MASRRTGLWFPARLVNGEGLGNLLTESWSKIWKSKVCLLIRRQSAKNQQACPLNEKAGFAGEKLVLIFIFIFISLLAVPASADVSVYYPLTKSSPIL